jgi:Zn-dependent protease with chaperone function
MKEIIHQCNQEEAEYMHTVFNTVGLPLIVLFGGLLILHLSSSPLSWENRRTLYLMALTFPFVISLLIIGGWVHVHVVRSCCPPMTFSWNHWVEIILLSFLSFSILGAVSYGGVRLLLMRWLMRRYPSIPAPHLQAQLNTLAKRQGLPPLTVQLSRHNRPLALVYGIHHPIIVLSTWMVEQLDTREFEAVLLHELMHIWRYDYLVNWIATVLRDAFFYLPASQKAYQRLRIEKEIACDDLVVAISRRPLALASALTKVWLHEVEQPGSSLVQTLVEKEKPIKSRVDRLLASSSVNREAALRDFSGRRLALWVTLTLVILGLILTGIEIRFWPHSWIWHLL